MAIRVKHDVSGSTAGAAAYAIGEGQKRERGIERYFKLLQQQIAISAKGSLQNRLLKYYRERDKAILEQKKESSASDQEHQQVMERMRADGLAARDERLHAGRMELADMDQAAALETLDAKNRISRDNIKWEYSEQQKREVEKIKGALTWLQEQVAEGSWRPEQAAEVKQQLMAKLHGIEKLPTLDTSPKPQEIFEQSRVTDSTTGQAYLFDGKKFTPINEQKKIGFKDYAVIYNSVAQKMKATSDTGEIDHEAVAKQVMGIISGYKLATGIEDMADNISKFPTPDMDAETIGAIGRRDRYDYAAAFKAGIIGPDQSGHWPSDFKTEGHPNFIVDGLNTKTAKPEQVVKTYKQMAAKQLGPGASKDEVMDLAKELARSKGWDMEPYDMPPDNQRTANVIKKALKSPEGFVKWAAEKYGYETSKELEYILKSKDKDKIKRALHRLGVI